MEPHNSPLVITTLHYPDARLLPMIEMYIPKLQEQFGPIIVAVTKFTDSSVNSTLISFGCDVRINQSVHPYDTYKLVLSTGIECSKSDQMLFYCEFDRLLHWERTYPEELESFLINDINVDFICVGRTDRAFATHPMTQIATESIINQIGSKILGLSPPIDIVGACWVMKAALAQWLLNFPIHTDFGLYASWSLLLWNYANSKKYVAVEGQEWETRDRYQNEINQVGYEQWLNAFQTSDEWQKRVQLLNDCIEEILHMTSISFQNPFV